MLTPARTQTLSTVESPKTWKSGSTPSMTSSSRTSSTFYRQRAVHVELAV